MSWGDHDRAMRDRSVARRLPEGWIDPSPAGGNLAARLRARAAEVFAAGADDATATLLRDAAIAVEAADVRERMRT